MVFARAIAALALLGSASAFAPLAARPRAMRTTPLQMAFDMEASIQETKV